MKFEFNKYEKIEGLSVVELKEILKTLEQNKLEEFKKILKETIDKRRSRISYYSKKLSSEAENTKIMLNILWNTLNVKTKEMAQVFKKIEDDLSG
ncbi:hypothetical protein EHP00_53 [Ecytonucleospora hepatopenaei]|uniref:Uncharacterized protein n=1 Tax=Ecytonucleospora hepatopenaei TaxID=646526 RepID=A0A1W0E5K1_9MICR|nr:hypothetical protein EHP00_53 [Ecytonucleospora hepatopenaei]